MFQNTINALFFYVKFPPMIDNMFLFTKIYLYIEELQYCTQQYEINKIRKYKMGHINNKKKTTKKRFGCNTERIKKKRAEKTLHNIM